MGKKDKAGQRVPGMQGLVVGGDWLQFYTGNAEDIVGKGTIQ